MQNIVKNISILNIKNYIFCNKNYNIIKKNVSRSSLAYKNFYLCTQINNNFNYIPVDQKLENNQKYEVFQNEDQIFSATLNKSDVVFNKNKFYQLQLLKNKETGEFFQFTRWGRIGQEGRFKLSGPYTEQEAIKQYNKKYKSKYNKEYLELEILYDNQQSQDKNTNQIVQTNEEMDSMYKSKLNPSVKKLMELIFDINMLNETMQEIGYDKEKCPLGLLGDNTITQAYIVLSKLSKLIESGEESHELLELSSDFYSLIPHNVGFQKMYNFAISTQEQIKQKIEMLEALEDMKISNSIMQSLSEDQEELHPMDKYYQKLDNKITKVSPMSQEFQKIMSFYRDSTLDIKVVDIFKLERNGEQENYNKDIGNDLLLWHGSRLQNFGGILKQGLRIAPPEAPVNGYAYGKGLYFSNNFATASDYSRTSSQDNLMLLCKVAVGNPGPLKDKIEPPHIDPQYDSCLGFDCSKLEEDCFGQIDNVKAPIKSYDLGDNAYIVYKENQAQLKYLIRYQEML